MSIVRFYLQTPTLPVFIPQINLNTNTNFGGTYPISAMSGSISAGTFTISLFSSVTFQVNTVVYLANNNLTPTTNDASATAQQYYRVTAVNYNVSGANTILTLANASASGTPSAYPTNFLYNASQVVSFAKLPIASMSYAAGLLSITYSGTGGLGTLADLTAVYKVGDTIYINNASQYNGTYVISVITATQIKMYAPNLATVSVLNPYAGGGYFLPIGDYFNVTPYIITMQYTPATGSGAGTLFSYSQPVIYQSNDLTTSPPAWNPANPQALSLADVTSQYYWVYNYEVFINQINQAITQCFWGLNGLLSTTTGHATSLPMSGSTATTYCPPSMSWNPSTLSAIMTADNNAFGQSTGASKNIVFMYANQPFSTLFDSFPYQYPNVLPSSNLYSYFVFNTNAGAGLYIVQSFTAAGIATPQYTGIQIYQDHQTASLMNPVQSIVFTSTLLPVVMENVGTPLILNGTAPTPITIGSNANIFPIVTDFVVPFSATDGYTPDITYTPTGEYRLVDLYGESPANQIDIQVFWKDVYGLLHPFLVGSGCSGALKVMFRRKSYNNVYEDTE